MESKKLYAICHDALGIMYGICDTVDGAWRNAMIICYGDDDERLFESFRDIRIKRGWRCRKITVKLGWTNGDKDDTPGQS